MAMNRQDPARITVIGCGPGAAEYVTPAARSAAEQAEVLVGSPRLLALFPEAAAERAPLDVDLEKTMDAIAAHADAARRVAVLVSGDPGLFSLAERVVARFGRERCEWIPGISSVQLALARLGLSWCDARIVSAHGRLPKIEPNAFRSAPVTVVLAGTTAALAWAADAAAALAATHVAFLAENLSLAEERIVELDAAALRQSAVVSLAMVLLVRRDMWNTPKMNEGTIPEECSALARTAGTQSPGDPSPRSRDDTPPRAKSSPGTLYGIGVGPGDPEWMTVKAARILGQCCHVCVPRSGQDSDSVALKIAQGYLRADAEIHELSFPMTADPTVLAASWRRAAADVQALLAQGEDCCFLTLGDCLLYSTYIYLLRELRAINPQAHVVTVPGITAFSAAAALSERPIGEGKQWVTIVPAADDFTEIRAALDRGGTVVLMKIGRRLERILGELEARGLLEQAVFVAHAGMPQQRIETDLRRLRGLSDKAGYLSILLVQAEARR